MSSIIIGIVVAVAIVLGFYFYFKSSNVSSTNRQLVDTAVDGKKQLDTSVALPESLNDPKGIAFSYTCWIRVDDYTYRFGEQKVIFTKGPSDLSSMCPGVLLDGNTNSILVKIDTFGSQETIPIGNLPAKKWFHFAVVVDQDSVDVYVNGIVHTHHTLNQLPRQNPSTVTVGVGGGFDGKLADLQYYNSFLQPKDVAASMGSPPQLDQQDTSAPLPPYFDITWWTGR
jgi:hypothetical protein